MLGVTLVVQDEQAKEGLISFAQCHEFLNIFIASKINPPTQIVQPVLGFMPAKIQRAEAELKLTVEQLFRLESCKEYVQTPIQTLDGIHVHQPHQFLPLAKEAKKLAEALKKEKDASQWAGIPHEN